MHASLPSAIRRLRTRSTAARPATALEPLERRVQFSGTVSFAGPTAVIVGDNHGVEVGEFNRDARPDLAIAGNGDNSVRVAVGTGSGRFSPPAAFNVREGPGNPVVGDFNGDGVDDVVTTNPGGNNIGIQLGDGRGGLGTVRFFPAGATPVWPAAADFNNDGKLDLAVSGWWSGGLHVLLGDGAGRFAAPADYRIEGNTQGVVAADINADGNSDLAVSNWSDDSVRVFLGDGRGGFSGRAFPAGGLPILLKAGDFNGDGKADLAAGGGIYGGREDKDSVILFDVEGGFGAHNAVDWPVLAGF
jgi:hypothetical protein